MRDHMTTKKQSAAHATNEHNQTLVNHIIAQSHLRLASLNCSSITKDSKDDLFQDII